DAVVEIEVMFGQAVADDLFVVSLLVSDRFWHTVLPFDNPIAIVVDINRLEAPEITDWLPDLNARNGLLDWLLGCSRVEKTRRKLETRVRQRKQFIAVGRVINRRCPTEIFLFDRVIIQLEFDPFIFHRGSISPYGAIQVRRRGH